MKTLGNKIDWNIATKTSVKLWDNMCGYDLKVK